MPDIGEWFGRQLAMGSIASIAWGLNSRFDIQQHQCNSAKLVLAQQPTAGSPEAELASKGSWHTAQMADTCPALATPLAPGSSSVSASRADAEAECTTRYGWFTACKKQ